MPAARLILLFVPDAAVRASLGFSLGLEGFTVVAGDAPADCLVIDQRQPAGDGVAVLARLRREGRTAPAIILATNPGRTLRERAAAAGALLVGPLHGDALPQAVHALLNTPAAA